MALPNLVPPDQRTVVLDSDGRRAGRDVAAGRRPRDAQVRAATGEDSKFPGDRRGSLVLVEGRRG